MIRNLPTSVKRYLSTKVDERIIGEVKRFRGRPTKIVFCDTFNNPFYPIPKYRVDKSSFDLPDVEVLYRKTYGVTNPYAPLPFHYFVEFVDNKYYVFQTRPLDLKFPLDWKEYKKIYGTDLITDKKAIRLFDRSGFDECIFVCILGDSDYDVYTKELYNVINWYILRPMWMYMRIQGSDDLIFLTGSKFKKNYLQLKATK